MKILIVGAGVAGLGLAHALQKKGIQPTIIDRNDPDSTRGYWIYMYDNGAKILQKIGLYDNYIKKAVPTTAYNVTNHQSKLLHSLQFTRSKDTYELPGCIDRPVLLEVLRQGINILDKTTIVNMHETHKGVDVELSNGLKETYDLVVGADGTFSEVRQNIMPHIQPKYYGIHIWLYFLTSADMRVPPVIRHAVGDGSYTVHFPNGKDKCGIYVAIKSKPKTITDATDVDSLLQNTYDTFSPEFKDCIGKKSLSSEQYSTDLMKVESKEWYKGRCVLIGDAQHAMSQLIGQGASLALEDAYVLAEEITTDGATIDSALAAFAKRRQARVRSMQRLSNVLMFLTSVDGRVGTMLRNLLLRVIPKHFILDNVERELKKPV